MSSSNGNGHIDWAKKRKVVKVELPEIEETVTLRALSAKQLDSLKGDDNNTTNLLAMSIVSPSLERIYTTPEDIDGLGEMSLDIRKKLSEQIGLLNGFSKEAIDEASKKSGANPPTDSASA